MDKTKDKFLRLIEYMNTTNKTIISQIEDLIDEMDNIETLKRRITFLENELEAFEKYKESIKQAHKKYYQKNREKIIKKNGDTIKKKRKEIKDKNK